MGPDYQNNKKRILDKSKFVDATFLTTEPRALDFKNDNFFFIPNPCDKSFETLNNFKYDNENDVFFAMSHGVHRGQLKKGKFDNREHFVNKLVKICDGIKSDIYGMNDIQPIWSDNFIECVSKSNMGLNLSRGKPIKYYSSDRISQLIGNGLLTFIDEKTYLSDFFNKNQVVFYKNIDDLKYNIEKYKRDNKKRKIIAENGKKIYFKNFNSTLVADYIVNLTLGKKLDKKKFIWSNYL